MVLGLKKIPNIWRDVSNLSSVSAVKDVGPRCSGCWPAGSGPAGIWVSVWQQQLLCSYRRPWKTPEKSVEVLYAASPGCCDLLSSVPFRTARMSPVLSFSVLYMQLCLRELHHAIHALMVVSHSRCQLLQRATARTAADAGGVWDTPATALGLPAGCLHVSMHVYSWRGSQLVLFQPMCPCLSSSIIKTSESPWLRRFFGTVGWQIPWGEHRCSPRSTSSPSSSGLSQEQDKSNPRGPCARYLGWFWGVIWRPDSGVGAGRGCQLQACSFEISTSGLSVCMPPAWGCEGVQASGTLAGDFGHWGMQAVKDVAQGDTGTEGHGCWGTWCRGMFCCETRAPRGTVTGRHEHWGKWHRGMLHWWTRALKADTEAEGSDGRGGRGRETRSPSTRSASRPSRQAARHGGAEQSRAGARRAAWRRPRRRACLASRTACDGGSGPAAGHGATCPPPTSSPSTTPSARGCTAPCRCPGAGGERPPELALWSSPSRVDARLLQDIPPVELALKDSRVALTVVGVAISPPVVPKGTLCQEVKVFPAECRGLRSTYRGRLTVSPFARGCVVSPQPRLPSFACLGSVSESCVLPWVFCWTSWQRKLFVALSSVSSVLISFCPLAGPQLCSFCSRVGVEPSQPLQEVLQGSLLHPTDH